jgi:uncharacterized metal-binding protein YceD (DUF177 family)
MVMATDPQDGLWALTHPLRVARLSNKVVTTFALRPDAAVRAALARQLGISAISTLSFSGTLTPRGRRDFVLQAHLTARVEQPCIVSLRPVFTTVSDDVQRRFLQDYVEPEGDEAELPPDDTAEPLPDVIDIGAVAVEALALVLPEYPRAPGASFVPASTDTTDPAIAEDRPKPFAGLADLAAKMAGKADENDENGQT